MLIKEMSESTVKFCWFPGLVDIINSCILDTVASLFYNWNGPLLLHATWDGLEEPPRPLHGTFRPKRGHAVKERTLQQQWWIFLKTYPLFLKTLGKRQARILRSLKEKM